MLSSCTAGSSSHELRSDMLDFYGSVYFARRLQKVVEVGEVGLESNLSRGNECDWFTESRFVPGQEGYVAAQDWVL